ncbi:MAG: hypothetical protein SF053_01850 [Bacteroidia bacterium]|nr:hypothetical protein [Bacteroidia bacterium]
MKTSFLLMAALLVLLMSGCNIFSTVEPSLPPETQQGADTFGALVDEAVWLPRSFLFGFLGNPYRPRLEAFFDTSTHTFYLESHRIIEKDSTEEGFMMFADSVTIGDTIWLGNEGYGYPPSYHERYAYFFDQKLNVTYTTWSEDSLTYAGYVYLTGVHTEVDGQPRFVAGTFAFTARNADSTRYVEVTDGRFDVRLSN